MRTSAMWKTKKVVLETDADGISILGENTYVNYVGIEGYFVNSAASRMHLMKILLIGGEEYVFQFDTAKERDEFGVIVGRKLKHTHRSGMDELRREMLASNRQLSRLHSRLVASGLVADELFWALKKKEVLLFVQKLNQKNVKSATLPNYVIKDGRYRINREEIELLLLRNPELQWAHEEMKLGQEDFLRLYFQSKFFSKDRKENKLDEVIERCYLVHPEWREQKKMKFINLHSGAIVTEGTLVLEDDEEFEELVGKQPNTICEQKSEFIQYIESGEETECTKAWRFPDTLVLRCDFVVREEEKSTECEARSLESDDDLSTLVEVVRLVWNSDADMQARRALVPTYRKLRDGILARTPDDEKAYFRYIFSADSIV